MPKAPYVDVAKQGAKGNGRTDDTAAIQHALNAARGGGHLHFPRKGGKPTTYSVRTVTVSTGTRITADDGVVIAARGTAVNGQIFQCASVYGRAVGLTEDVGKGDRRIRTAAASGMRAGGVAVVRDETYKFGGNNGPNLEFVEVAEVSGNDLVLRSGLIGEYRVGRSARLTPLVKAARDIRFEGVHCNIPAQSDGGAFYFQDAYRCEVVDCGSSGQRGQPGIQIWRSAFVTVRRGAYTEGRDVAMPGCGYGCNIAQSSHDCWAIGVTFRNVRECAVASNARFSGYIDCESFGSYDNAFNAHQDGSEDCWFIHCTSHDARSKGFCAGGTAGWAGDKRIHFIECTSNNSGYIGFWASGSAGVESEDIQFVNCIAVHPGAQVNPSYGFYCSHSRSPRIIDCLVDAGGERNCRAGINLEQCVDVRISGGEVRALADGWGVVHSGCTGVTVAGTRFSDIHGQSVYSAARSASSTDVSVRDIQEQK